MENKIENIKHNVDRSITIKYTNAESNKDWLGIYLENSDPNNDFYEAWLYVEGTGNGTVTFTKDNQSLFPLKVGK